MRRHLERAKLHQPAPAGTAIRRVHFIDTKLGAMPVAGHIRENVAKQPVHEPRRRILAVAHLLERDFQLIQRILARLINTRMLAGGANEQPAEQEAERRVIMPEPQHGFQQIRPAQKRTVAGRRPAHHHMVAAAGADMPAIQHELLGHQPNFAGHFIKLLGALDDLTPACRRVDVRLNHTRVRRHGEIHHACIFRRQITFQHHLPAHAGGGLLHRGGQFQPVAHIVQRRIEHMQNPIARFHRQCGPHQAWLLAPHHRRILRHGAEAFN